MMRFWSRPDFDALADRWRGRRVVLAYHRVGDRSATPFDPGMVSADADALETQIRHFQKRHRIVGLDEALEIASQRRAPRGAAILLTFDDGYLDNYEVALPVLKATGVEAVFFLVSGFLNGTALPWWDEIAWLVRTARERRFEFSWGEGVRTLDLRNASPEAAIGKVLELYKAASAKDAGRIIETLRDGSKDGPVQPPPRLLCGTLEAKALHEAGMTIGAHSHTHPVLARLSEEAQARELTLSRSILEQTIGTTVDVMAYPVGGPKDFNAGTRAAARAGGYRAAFSCHGGFNRAGRADLFNIKRVPVYWDARPDWLLQS